MSNQAIATFKGHLQTRRDQFKDTLPKHVGVDNFIRCALTAVADNPKLLESDQTSLFGSLIKCAQDGLIPNGKEAALIVFKTKSGNNWIKKVQYMPMVDGVLKRARQSGVVENIAAKAVYSNDQFDYWMDEAGEHVHYKPDFDNERGQLKMVFAFAKLKSGELVIEIMPRLEIEKVRLASRSPDSGPWVDWYDRMALKSVLHRLSRRLPNSSEIMEMLDRGNFMYDFDKGDKEAGDDTALIEQHGPAKVVDQLNGLLSQQAKLTA